MIVVKAAGEVIKLAAGILLILAILAYLFG